MSLPPTLFLQSGLGARIYVIDATPQMLDIDFIKTYLVADNAACALIDSGPSNAVSHVVETLTRLCKNQETIYIVLTHIHLDHGGGAALVAEHLAQQGYRVETLVHPRGEKHLRDPSKLWQASRQVLGERAYEFGEPAPYSLSGLRSTSDGEKLGLGNTVLEIIHTPGHASHHQSIVLELPEGTIVFTGDSAGVYDPLTSGLAPTTPPPFRLEPFLQSLEKMKAYNPEWIAPTHLGPGPGNLLEKHEEQVKLWVDIVSENPGLSTEQLLEKILEKDELSRKLYTGLGWSKQIQGVLVDSIEGIKAYIEQAKR
jgi:glyoxylase-like metal-dependent hydrolase (beta-lactamase superfamily II)